MGSVGLQPPNIQLNAVVRVDSDGNTTANGTLLIHRAETNKAKVFHATSGDGTSASCADTDNDGDSGLFFLAGHFVANNGEELDLSFRPTGGDLDGPGQYNGVIVIQEDEGPVLVESETTIRFDRARR